MDQFVRDVRVTTMYEGTTGIQAMDMAKRKLSSGDGQLIETIFAMIDEECEKLAPYEALQPLAEAMTRAKADYHGAAKWMLDNGISERANGSYYFLELSGIVMTGLMWLKMSGAAAKALEAGAEDRAFYETKIPLANYFADTVLPDTQSLRAKIDAGNKHLMSLSLEAFELSA